MSSKVKRWAPLQMFWSSVAGAVVIIALGFSWFGAGFGWHTEHGAEAMAEEAVTAQTAQICVGQALEAAAEDLMKFRETSTWSRRQIVEESGWATMPGAESFEHSTASACATQLFARLNDEPGLLARQ